ncbi:hypothetical protein ACFWHJ_37615, partial [Streptomyces cyaneofuscatus]
GNPVRTETAYGDGTPGSVSEQEFDALGKAVRTEENNTAYTAGHSYTPSGLPEADTLTPKQPGTGESVTARHFLDAFGNKTGKSLSRGGESVEGWKSVFDPAGRLAQVTAPGDGGTTTTAYDQANGLVESTVLPDGTVVHQRYDAAGRVTESWTSPKDDPEARHEHTHTSYDPVTGQVAAVWFDGDEDGSKITFGYHPDGSVKERIDPGGKSTSFTYNDEGKVLTVTDHTGAVTTSSYEDSTGRLAGAVQTRDGQELGKVSYGYDAAGRLVKTDRGNGAVSTYAFNDAGLPTGEKHTRPGGQTIAEHGYTYDEQRRLTGDTATLDEDGTQKKTTTAYAYNDQGNLTRSHMTEGHTPGEGTLISKTEYAYDLATNLTERKDTRVQDGKETTTVTGFGHDTAHRTT